MVARIRARDDSGTLRTIARIRMRDDTGTLRTIQRIRIRDAGNTLRTVFEYFSISVSPTSVSQSGSTATVITSVPAVVSVVGGTGPFSYAWANQFGDPIQISSPGSASTTFRKTSMLIGDFYQATFVCTVTDVLGTILETDPVEVTIERT